MRRRERERQKKRESERERKREKYMNTGWAQARKSKPWMEFRLLTTEYCLSTEQDLSISSETVGYDLIPK